MSLLIESYLPVVQQGGLNTNKAAALGSTLSVTGAVTMASTLTVTGTVTLSGALAGATSMASTGAIAARSATATPAAAAAAPAFVIGSAGVSIYWGTGSPNTVVTAAKGSLYIRTDGSSTNDRMYVNTDGTTAWTNFTTAA